MVFESGIISPASETLRFRSSTESFVKSSEYKLKAFGTAFERAWTQSVFDFSDEALWTLNDNVESNRHARSNILLPYAA